MAPTSPSPPASTNPPPTATPAPVATSATRKLTPNGETPLPPHSSPSPLPSSLSPLAAPFHPPGTGRSKLRRWTEVADSDDDSMGPPPTTYRDAVALPLGGDAGQGPSNRGGISPPPQLRDLLLLNQQRYALLWTQGRRPRRARVAQAVKQGAVATATATASAAGRRRSSSMGCRLARGTTGRGVTDGVALRSVSGSGGASPHRTPTGGGTSSRMTSASTRRTGAGHDGQGSRTGHRRLGLYPKHSPTGASTASPTTTAARTAGCRPAASAAMASGTWPETADNPAPCDRRSAPVAVPAMTDTTRAASSERGTPARGPRPPLALPRRSRRRDLMPRPLEMGTCRGSSRGRRGSQAPPRRGVLAGRRRSRRAPPSPLPLAMPRT